MGVWTSQPHTALGNALYASLLKRIPDIQQLPPDRDIGATIHELEADQIGLKYMARAGYGPHEAIAFWKRMMETKNGQQPPELPSTHPAIRLVSANSRILRQARWRSIRKRPPAVIASV